MLTEKHKENVKDPEKDMLGNTELSVIDRLILSQELNEQELLNETFTIFTSVRYILSKFLSLQGDKIKFEVLQNMVTRT